MGLFDEKNRGSKISWHCPFNVHTWKKDGLFLCLPDLVCSRSGGITSASGSQSLSSESSSPPPLSRPCNFPDFLSDRSRFMKIQNKFKPGLLVKMCIVQVLFYLSRKATRILQMLTVILLHKAHHHEHYLQVYIMQWKIISIHLHTNQI
jgi:hypothetical protein